MRLLLSYLKENKKILFLALFLATINQVASLFDPQIFRLIIDNYATKIATIESVVFIKGTLTLLLAGMSFALISRVAKNFQDYFVNVITQRVGAHMYGASVAHAFNLPYSVFENQRSGELLQKLQKARTDSQALITSAINILFLSLIGIVFVLTYAFIVHWAIGLLYVLLIPIVGVSTFIIGRKIKTAQKRIVLESSDLAGSTTETLRNVELVKSLGLENQESERLNIVNQKILSLELKKVKLIRTLSFIQGTLINAMRSLILFTMLFLIFKQAISLGQFFSLLFYSFFIFGPLQELGTVSAQYQEARASLETLREVLSIKPGPKPIAPHVISDIRNIDFKNVSFSYEGSAKKAIAKISLSLKRGETVAFVGPSGSGKTTMVKLLVGLYRPTNGSIKINDYDAREIDYAALRKRIGYVSQETQLFAGTIRENMLFVKPEATDEECMAALRGAAAGGILERGDKGLDTKIGEGGLKLSGGERQRLAIARALLREPDIIIFDEATSSLDSITEKSITETIKEITIKRPDLITVLVAHRLSTVLHANTIYVLERGEIEEANSHEKLLKTHGLYSALWREQVAMGE